MLALAARRGTGCSPFNVCNGDRVPRIFGVENLRLRTLDVGPVEGVPEKLWFRRYRAAEGRKRVGGRHGVGAACFVGHKVALSWLVAWDILGAEVHDGPVPREDIELGLGARHFILGRFVCVPFERRRRGPGDVSGRERE